MHASLRSHGQSLRELHSLLVEHLPRGTNAALRRLVAQQNVNLHKQRCFAQASDRDRQAQRVPDPKAQDLESLSRGKGGGYGGGGGLCEGVSGGGLTPGGFFDSSRRIFRRNFFCGFFLCILRPKRIHRKIHRKIHRSVESSCFRNPPALRHQKFTGLPPPRESKSKSCAFGSGTVTFQGGSFQEKTPGLIGPCNLRILIGRIAVGWPCMECHVPSHIGIYWVWDSVKQSEGWGRNPALIARSPTRHSKLFIENFHHKSSLLVWLPKKLTEINRKSQKINRDLAGNKVRVNSLGWSAQRLGL